MELLGHEVSERVIIPCVLTSVGQSAKDENVKYANFCTPLGEFSARILPDVDYSNFIGHAVEAGLRLISPQFRKSKYPRRWYCDSLKEASPF